MELPDDLCPVCQDLFPAAISRRRRGWTGSLPIDYEALKKTAIPAGECYACYLLIQALGKLNLKPTDKISHLEINGERFKGETMSLLVVLGDGERQETLEFYCIQGKWSMIIFTKKSASEILRCIKDVQLPLTLSYH